MSAAAILARTEEPGRFCPLDYRYPPSALNRAPDLAAEVLYVAGGLYGNLAALRQVEWLAGREREPVTIVYNGDFHWFDAEPDWFMAIQNGVARHRALRGNVETEIARAGDVGAGCGCAYPANVEEGIVSRSNEILNDLRAAADDATSAQLAALPMHLVASVGALRVGIVHGDATALAGWGFAHDALDDRAHATWRSDIRAQSGIDVFASTHTCLAALRDFATPAGRLTVINNGAAGMANFSDTGFGLISRIAARPSPHEPLYGLRHGDLCIDAIPVRYDLAAFLARFEPRWPPGSAAHRSYYQRITRGPSHTIEQARARALAA
jgi:hypothetical protein